MSKTILAIILIVFGIGIYFQYAVDATTPAIWQTKFEANISSDPIAASGNYVFWGGNLFDKVYKLFVINSQGQKIAESVNLPSSPFNPIVVDNYVIAADHARMLRAYSLPDLKVVWEAAGNDAFENGPVKNGKTVLQASGQSIFCFDVNTGKQLWDITELDTLKNFAADKVILTIHGYKDLKVPTWKCSAYDTEEGLSLWKLDEPVSSISPIFVKNAAVLTTKDGEGLVLNQLTGEIMYKTKGKGLIQVVGLDNAVIFVTNDFKNMVYLSLLTGKSWSTTIKKDVIGAAQIGSRVMIVDKTKVRCFDSESGLLAWEKELGDVYAASGHRNGLFVVYKKRFTAKETYAICLGPATNKELWKASAKSMFRKPYPLSEGDLLVNNNGIIRLMPKPVFHNTTTVSMPEINMPDPSAKVNQAFEKQQTKQTQTMEQEPQENLNPEELPDKIQQGAHIPTKEEKKKQIENEIKQDINKNIGVKKNTKTKTEAIPKDLAPVSDQDAGW